jgi:hypothetical protein
MLHIYATQDTATAQLNLVSSSYSAVLNGSPTFTVDRGYTGVDASSTVYINSQFNPLTASSPKFTQNNAHMSYWSNTNVQSSASGGLAMGSTGGGTSTYIFSRYPTDIMGFRINGTNVAGTTNTDSTGHYLGTRTGTSTLAGYKNGAVVQGPAGDGVGTPHNSNILIMAISNAGTPAFGSGMQFTMASIGNTLNSTQVGNFYTRLRTYMTTMGVP